MFSYYGGKGKLVKKYPKPIYDLIIEPFAGSARYSQLHSSTYSNNRVLLNDSYKVVADIWDYLINATREQIEALPEMNKGDKVSDLNISDVEKSLMGFWVNYGVATPANVYTTWAYQNNEIRRSKLIVIRKLNDIRHWKVSNKDYKELKNIEATWFIDPPYQKGGSHYVKSTIDYEELTEWCKSRKGQVIVCENADANWLPFKLLSKLSGQGRNKKSGRSTKSVEVVWKNKITNRRKWGL